MNLLQALRYAFQGLFATPDSWSHLGPILMNHTPVHENHNPDLLDIIPWGSKKLIEVGCSSGALAREFKKLSPNCHYLGIEIDPAYAELALRYCDQSQVLDIETAGDAFWKENADRDCWIFGDTLEHLKDPWRVLRQVRSIMPKNACIAACIPNAQHWSLQAKLSIGDFRYEDTGLLDRTHLRFFSRQTILEMFNDAGFTVTACIPRIFHEPPRERFLPVIEQLAKLAGANPQTSVDDAMPLQYVVSAAPR